MKETVDAALALELKTLRYLEPVNQMIDRGDSPVQQFYDNATVFVTGGSGFIGKQLIEKLFRACNIKKLYLLLRVKKGKSVNERLQEMLEDPVFETLRKKKPNFADKIFPMEGDIAAIKLGLNAIHWDILTQEVNIIFHVAATVKFDERLSVATLINVRGTKETLTLGLACHKLRSFVHVSTTYANATAKTLSKGVLETFYPPPISPDALIGLVESVEDSRLKEIEATFIRGYPNTYTFTKSVAEAEVSNRSGKLPVCIVRPAIVISAYKEPSPGWTDLSCAYGTSGLVTGPALGLMHVIYAKKDTKFNMVPVDYINNALIIAAYETGRIGRTDAPRIYNVASSKNTLSWNYLLSIMNRLRSVLPSPMAIWYIFVLVTSSLPIFLVLSWIFHFIPAYIVDGVYILGGKRPRYKYLTRKMYNISRALSYYTTHSWTFADSNTERLYQSLAKSDKIIFNFNTNDIDHSEYIPIWIIGLRKYIFKDGLQNTKYAVKKQFWLKILHFIICGIYFYIIWKTFVFVFSGIDVLYSLFFVSYV